MNDKIDYSIESQSGFTTIFSIPISKKETPSDLEIVTLRKGQTYTGKSFFQVYRGQKMVKQFLGSDSEATAYDYIQKLQEAHQASSE